MPLKPQKRCNFLEAVAVHGEEDVGAYGGMDIEQPGENPFLGYSVIPAIPLKHFPYEILLVAAKVDHRIIVKFRQDR